MPLLGLASQDLVLHSCVPNTTPSKSTTDTPQRRHMAAGGATGSEELWRRHQSTDGAAACTAVTAIRRGEC